MIEITPQDFYRIWILADAGRESLDRDKNNFPGDAEVQYVRGNDAKLLQKFRTCWELGLLAEFQTKQVK